MDEPQVLYALYWASDHGDVFLGEFDDIKKAKKELRGLTDEEKAVCPIRKFVPGTAHGDARSLYVIFYTHEEGDTKLRYLGSDERHSLEEINREHLAKRPGCVSYIKEYMEVMDDEQLSLI